MTSTLTHTTSFTSYHPDRFEDPETGWGYSVRHDDAAEDPRTWIDPKYAALWAYGEPHLSRSVAAVKPKGNIVIDAFARFLEIFTAEESLELTERWLRIFHPDSTYQVATHTICGYAQSDWLEMIAVVEDGYGTPESHLEQFRQWAFGDVWTVTPDWTAGVSAIYADSAEEALEQFREDFGHENPMPAASRGPSVRRRAIDLPNAGAVVQRGSIHRWHTEDAIVVADRGLTTSSRGVFIRPVHPDTEQIQDPDGLAAALLAAQAVLDEEI